MAYADLSKPIPDGLCQCGCGAPTTIIDRNVPSRGLVAGRARLFRSGHQRRRDPMTLFTVNADTDCWEWIGTLTHNGYGCLGNKLAHILFYEQYRGPKPPGLDLDHLCRNRRCVNPQHLEAVSRAVNLRRGTKVVLNESSARQVKARLAAGIESKAAIARSFGVSVGVIAAIARCVTWRDV